MASLFKLALLVLLMRKKFFIRWGRSFDEPFVCREELDIPEKLRFSEAGDALLCDEELKSCVMMDEQDQSPGWMRVRASESSRYAQGGVIKLGSRLRGM